MSDAMQNNCHVQEHERVLIAALEKGARLLPSSAAETADLLRKYATEIAEPTTRDKALISFDRLASDYKGLRDFVVPGVSESEWFRVVEELRVLSKSALRARGLDKSLVGRLRRLFGS